METVFLCSNVNLWKKAAKNMILLSKSNSLFLFPLIIFSLHYSDVFVCVLVKSFWFIFGLNSLEMQRRLIAMSDVLCCYVLDDGVSQRHQKKEIKKTFKFPPINIVSLHLVSSCYVHFHHHDYLYPFLSLALSPSASTKSK